MSSTKSVLITGCSDGGIGAGLATAFHGRGFRVFATARDPSKMAELSKLDGMKLLTLDVEQPDQIAAAVEAVKSETDGKLDILINNSGRNHFSPVFDIDIQEARRIYDINFWGALAVLQAFSPLVVKARGTMVSVTSIAGHINVPYMGLYAASKRSLEIIMETMRLEVKPFGVNILSVVTGAVQSNGQTCFEDWKLPASSLYKPVEKLIFDRARGHDGVPRMPLAEYSEKVAGDIIQGTTGKIWCGAGESASKFGASPIPQDLIDSSVSRGCGLELLSQEN